MSKKKAQKTKTTKKALNAKRPASRPARSSATHVSVAGEPETEPEGEGPATVPPRGADTADLGAEAHPDPDRPTHGDTLRDAASAASVPEGGADGASGTTANPRRAFIARSEGMPPVGTSIEKRDRHGNVRCACTVVEGGVDYKGVVYRSLSAAAMVASRDLGLGTRAINGWLFWGLSKPARAPGTRRRDPLARLQPILDRCGERVRAAIEAADAEAAAKVREAVVAHASRLIEIGTVNQ